MADDKATAVVGAQAVADAVKRVADAAVAEVTKVPAVVPQELSFSGAGSKFAITGSGFSSSGTVLLNGVALPTTSWSTTRIEGNLPAGAKSGEVVVRIDEKTSRKGRFTAAV